MRKVACHGEEIVQTKEGTATDPAWRQGQVKEGSFLQQQEEDLPTNGTSGSEGWTTDAATDFAQEKVFDAQDIAKIESGRSRSRVYADSLFLPTAGLLTP